MKTAILILAMFVTACAVDSPAESVQDEQALTSASYGHSPSTAAEQAIVNGLMLRLASGGGASTNEADCTRPGNPNPSCCSIVPPGQPYCCCDIFLGKPGCGCYPPLPGTDPGHGIPSPP